MKVLMVLTSHDKLGDTSRAASKMPIGTTRICEQRSCLSPVAVRLRRAVCLTTPLREAPVVGDDALRRERPRYRSEFLEHVMLAYAGDRIFSGSSRHCGSSGSSLDRL